MKYSYFLHSRYNPYPKWSIVPNIILNCKWKMSFLFCMYPGYFDTGTEVQQHVPCHPEVESDVRRPGAAEVVHQLHHQRIRRQRQGSHYHIIHVHYLMSTSRTSTWMVLDFRKTVSSIGPDYTNRGYEFELSKSTSPAQKVYQRLLLPPPLPRPTLV